MYPCLFGVNRDRSTVHNWVQMADLEPGGGRYPHTIALSETVIKVTSDQFGLIVAVTPDTNVILHLWLYPSGTTALMNMFLREL